MNIMLEQNKVKEIKKLIENGFDLELIAFELDLPLKLLIQYKKEISTYSTLRQIKSNYNRLFFRNNNEKRIEPTQLSEQEIELIDSVLLTVEQNIDEMKNLSKKEKHKIAISILSEFKKIEALQLPLEKAESLYKLINSEELQGLTLSMSDKIEIFIGKQKRISATQFGRAIEVRQYDVNDDIDELKLLKRKITMQMKKESPLIIGGIETKLSNKITLMEQQNSMFRLRNDISPNILAIINNLVNGEIDISEASSIIGEEAKIREKNKPKTRFALTEEQERKQILVQITTAIKENPDKYNIKDPDITIIQIQKLCECTLEQAISAVVENFIGKKDYQTARNICDNYSEETKDTDLENPRNKYIRRLKKLIISSEIGDIVLKMLSHERNT